jgi:hypothetical protein
LKILPRPYIYFHTNSPDLRKLLLELQIIIVAQSSFVIRQLADEASYSKISRMFIDDQILRASG